MRKTVTTLSLAAALFAGQALADPATVESLQAYGVPLTAEQTTQISNADGQQLVDAIAGLVSAQPAMAATIVVAAINARPSLTDDIVNAAIVAAPAQEPAIRNAVEANQGPLGPRGNTQVPTSSLPSIGSGSVASPN